VTPLVVVLSAPSGAGKTTIARRLVSVRKDVGVSVSATTRPARRGEKDGKAYYFMPREKFERLRERGDFLECAQYAGAWYGTLKSEVKRIHDAGRHVLLDIEIEGARAIRRAYPPPQSVSIFVLPPSPRALIQRLKRRRSESADSLSLRLRRAVEELRAATEYDYIIVNRRLPKAVSEVGRIIDVEASRTARRVDLHEQLKRLSEALETQAKSLVRKTTNEVQ